MKDIDKRLSSIEELLKSMEERIASLESSLSAGEKPKPKGLTGVFWKIPYMYVALRSKMVNSKCVHEPFISRDSKTVTLSDGRTGCLN